MENISTTRNQIILRAQNSTDNYTRNDVQVEEVNLVYDKLLAEGSEHFFDYLEKIGLANNTNMVLLPSSHHYYYDAEDLREVKTIVNLKELNKIKQLKDFLNNIFHILPKQSYFIGNFIDGKTQLGLFPNNSNGHSKTVGIDPIENGISSRIPFLNMIYDIMDSKTNKLLTKKSVTGMLEEAGFKILDMSDIKGYTYFSVHKSKFVKE